MTDAQDLPARLLALADRCEQEEPTFELECAIAEATGWYRPHPDLRRPKVMTPKFCSSLDAAVTLVPEDQAWYVGRMLGTNLACSHYSTEGFVTAGSKTVKPKTPALALCAAALRARAAVQS